MDSSADSTTATGGDTSPSLNGLSFWKYMAAGTVTGMVEHMAMFPVDIVKTRMQMAGATSALPLPGNSAAHFSRFFASIVQNSHSSKPVMASPAVQAPRAAASKTESYVDNKRKQDIRQANIIAARAVADAVRTSLGPKGMDKMISAASGEVIITNDGATILNKMEVLQPAAKMLVELSKSQDIVAGDGTTTAVVIAGALLKQCLSLLNTNSGGSNCPNGPPTDPTPLKSNLKKTFK